MLLEVVGVVVLEVRTNQRVAMVVVVIRFALLLVEIL